jgi:uncharacterized membrane protein
MPHIAPSHQASPEKIARVNILPTIASGSLISLIILCLGWELWWAPLRPGGSMLVLKAVLLLLPLRGVLKVRRYTLQWTSLLLLFYLLEGATRGTSDQGLSQYLAQAELVLTLICFTTIVTYLRMTRPPKENTKLASHLVKVTDSFEEGGTVLGKQEK